VRTFSGARVSGTVTEAVETSHGRRDFEVAADGFWQPHVDAPRLLVEIALELAGVRPGERVLDLYAGVGLFSAFLADAAGPDGHVLSVEGDRTASRLAARNLADLPHAEVRHGPVEKVLRGDVGHADVVLLDPPRVGARRKVVGEIARREPRAVVYVACDPAALARDVGYFAEAGYRLEHLRALDLFPMTHHVECVALLVPGTA
jgi:tRNA/tmRNA/rRNA uracil-C5-methylase (TrmA/RlmC/RlmD family)